MNKISCKPEVGKFYETSGEGIVRCVSKSTRSMYPGLIEPEIYYQVERIDGRGTSQNDVNGRPGSCEYVDFSGFQLVKEVSCPYITVIEQESNDE